MKRQAVDALAGYSRVQASASGGMRFAAKRVYRWRIHGRTDSVQGSRVAFEKNSMKVAAVSSIRRSRGVSGTVASGFMLRVSRAVVVAWTNYGDGEGAVHAPAKCPMTRPRFRKGCAKPRRSFSALAGSQRRPLHAET